MTKRRIIKNVLITTGPNGGRPNIKNICDAEKDRTPPTWKCVLEKLRSVQVALLNVDLELAKYKAGGGPEFTPAPSILDQETFPAPEGDPSGE